MEKYLDHLAGITFLVEWHERWKRHSKQSGLSSLNVLDLSDWVAQRFVLGSPRRPRYGAGAFIGFQQAEALWMSRIQWTRATVVEEGSRFYLVSKRVLGDGEKMPDLPSLAVGFPVADKATLDSLLAFSRMEGRQVWADEDQLQVTQGRPVFSLPLSSVPTSSQLFRDNELQVDQGVEDLLQKQIERTNRYNVQFVA